MNTFEQMGIMGYPLLVCSIFVLAIIAERLIFFLRTYGVSEKTIQEILQLHQLPLPEKSAQSLKNHRFGELLLELFGKQTLDNEERERLFSLRLLTTQKDLLQYLPLLKVLASISPLLGLLGTILGMIEAFNAMALIEGPIRPAIIANGVSQAMLTTAAGLIVAIPALLAHSLFQMRASSLIQGLTEQLNLLNQHLQHMRQES